MLLCYVCLLKIDLDILDIHLKIDSEMKIFGDVSYKDQTHIDR